MASNNRKIIALAGAWGINTLAYSIVYPFLPIYLNEIRGIPLEKAGLIFPIMGIGVFLGSPIGGHLVDRFSCRLVYVLSPILRAVVFLLLAYAVYIDASFWIFSLLLLFNSMFATMFSSASNAYVANMIDAPEERQSAFGVLRIGLNVGWMAGPAIGAFLARTPFSLIFSITGILCLFTAVITILYCPPVNKKTEELDSPHKTNDGYLAILKNDRKLLFLFVMAFLLYAGQAQFIPLLSVFSTQVIGISKPMLGYLFSLNGIIVVIFMSYITGKIRKFPPYYMLAVGALIYTAGYLVYGLSFNWAMLALGTMVITFGEILIGPSTLRIVSTLSNEKNRGRYMSLHELVRGAGWSFGPWFGSILYARFTDNYFGFWAIFSGLFMVFAAILYARGKKYKD
jgi:predicted MFS family arabinose efflux permease